MRFLGMFHRENPWRLWNCMKDNWNSEMLHNSPNRALLEINVKTYRCLILEWVMCFYHGQTRANAMPFMPIILYSVIHHCFYYASRLVIETLPSLHAYERQSIFKHLLMLVAIIIIALVYVVIKSIFCWIEVLLIFFIY